MSMFSNFTDSNIGQNRSEVIANKYNAYTKWAQISVNTLDKKTVTAD